MVVFNTACTCAPCAKQRECIPRLVGDAILLIELTHEASLLQQQVCGAPQLLEMSENVGVLYSQPSLATSEDTHST